MGSFGWRVVVKLFCCTCIYGLYVHTVVACVTCSVVQWSEVKMSMDTLVTEVMWNDCCHWYMASALFVCHGVICNVCVKVGHLDYGGDVWCRRTFVLNESYMCHDLQCNLNSVERHSSVEGWCMYASVWCDIVTLSICGTVLRLRGDMLCTKDTLLCHGQICCLWFWIFRCEQHYYILSYHCALSVCALQGSVTERRVASVEVYSVNTLWVVWSIVVKVGRGQWWSTGVSSRGHHGGRDIAWVVVIDSGRHMAGR